MSDIYLSGGTAVSKYVRSCGANMSSKKRHPTVHNRKASNLKAIYVTVELSNLKWIENWREECKEEDRKVARKKNRRKKREEKQVESKIETNAENIYES